MNRRLVVPLLGTVAAIAITTSLDAMGLSAFSALPLLPLALLLLFREGFSRRDLGLTWARPRDYALAALHPGAVLGTILLICVLAGATDLSRTDWPKAMRDVAVLASATTLVAILTEEGFFRGWLWASLERSGMPPSRVLIWSSVAFSLWHVSAVSLDTGFDLPPGQIPVYLLNAFLLGAIWGLLRQQSGSVIVASVAHGVWNGIAYVLFGFGERVGALGITNTAVFGPEVGVLGTVANGAFLLLLWWTGTGARVTALPAAAPAEGSGAARSLGVRSRHA